MLGARGADADETLVRALSKRNLQVVACDDPHESFARICNDARAGNRSILVFSGDQARGYSEQIVGAMERFAPSAVCWNHLPGANPPIQPLVGPLGGAIEAAMKPEPKPERIPEQKPEASGESVSAPKLRLTASPQGAPKQAPMSAKDVLDADELDALLASEVPPKKNDGV